MASPVLMRTGGLTAYAFDAAQLGVFARPVGPGQFMPLGPSEILAASGAQAALDGPEFGVCDGRGYETYQCGYPQELIYDNARGIVANGQRSSSGMTISVVGGNVQVTRGAQAVSGANVAVQLYPSLIENGHVVASNVGSNADSLWRAAVAVISPTRLALVIGNMPMVEFATRIRDQLGANDAGYTDGGGSTALVLPGRIYGSSEHRRVPTWIVVNPPSGVNPWVIAGGAAALAAVGIYWVTRRSGR